MNTTATAQGADEALDSFHAVLRGDIELLFENGVSEAARAEIDNLRAAGVRTPKTFLAWGQSASASKFPLTSAALHEHFCACWALLIEAVAAATVSYDPLRRLRSAEAVISFVGEKRKKLVSTIAGEVSQPTFAGLRLVSGTLCEGKTRVLHEIASSCFRIEGGSAVVPILVRYTQLRVTGSSFPTDMLCSVVVGMLESCFKEDLSPVFSVGEHKDTLWQCLRGFRDLTPVKELATLVARKVWPASSSFVFPLLVDDLGSPFARFSRSLKLNAMGACISLLTSDPALPLVAMALLSDVRDISLVCGSAGVAVSCRRLPVVPRCELLTVRAKVKEVGHVDDGSSFLGIRDSIGYLGTAMRERGRCGLLEWLSTFPNTLRDVSEPLEQFARLVVNCRSSEAASMRYEMAVQSCSGAGLDTTAASSGGEGGLTASSRDPSIEAATSTDTSLFCTSVSVGSSREPSIEVDHLSAVLPAASADVSVCCSNDRGCSAVAGPSRAGSEESACSVVDDLQALEEGGFLLRLDDGDTIDSFCFNPYFLVKSSGFLKFAPVRWALEGLENNADAYFKQARWQERHLVFVRALEAALSLRSKVSTKMIALQPFCDELLGPNVAPARCSPALVSQPSFRLKSLYSCARRYGILWNSVFQTQEVAAGASLSLSGQYDAVLTGEACDEEGRCSGASGGGDVIFLFKVVDSPEDHSADGLSLFSGLKSVLSCFADHERGSIRHLAYVYVKRARRFDDTAQVLQPSSQQLESATQRLDAQSKIGELITGTNVSVSVHEVEEGGSACYRRLMMHFDTVCDEQYD